MILAKWEMGRRCVELSYIDNRSPYAGYWVHHSDEHSTGSAGPFRNRTEAEEDFVWAVGYPEWQAAGDAAFLNAKKDWLANHKDMDSLGVEALTI